RVNPSRLDAHLQRPRGRALFLENGHDIHRGAGRDCRQQDIKRAGRGLRIAIDANPRPVRPAGLEVEGTDPLHVDWRVSYGSCGWHLRVPAADTIPARW